MYNQNPKIIKYIYTKLNAIKNLNENEKGFKETEYKNDPEKLSKYMKMDYLPSKERYEKLLADNEKKYKTLK